MIFILLNIFNNIIKIILKITPEVTFNAEIVAPLFLEKYSQVNTEEKI
jgi:hypothetical protein